MAFLLLAWLLCTWISFCLGTIAILLCGGHLTARDGDRLLLTLWTGFALTGVVLLALSLHHPLRPMDVALLAIASGIAATAARDFRKELAAITGRVSPGLLLTGIALAVTAGAVSIQVVSNRDAISYHYDIIHWLSRLGTVPGVALVHERLGYVSSWHTLPAALNHGMFSYRTVTASSGFALLLAACHLHLSAYRILRGSGRGLDWFMLLSLSSVLAPSLLLNYPVSPSPDFAILLMVLVVAWTALLAHHPDRAGDVDPMRGFLPVVLSAAAVTMKVVALPLLAATLAWYVIRSRRSMSSVAGGFLVAAAILLPALIAWTKLSGCPLLPLPLCFDLPWTVPRAGQSLTGFFPFTREAYSPSFAAVKENLAAGAGLAGATLLILWLLVFRRTFMVRVWPVLLIGLSGAVFFLLVAPQARFLLGYIAIMIFSVTLHFEKEIPAWLKSPIAGNGAGMALSFAAVVIVTIPPCIFFNTKSEKRIAQANAGGEIILHDRHRMLLPPEIPKLVYDDDKGLALPFPHPETAERSSYTSERGVFYPLEENSAIEFRDPERGVRGGFRRRDER